MSVVGTTLSVVYFTLSVVRTTLSVGHNALLIGQLQTYTLSVVHNARSVVSIYSVGCTHYLDHSPFLGMFLKTNSTKNYTITTYGTSTGSVGCPRLQLPWRGSPWWCPRKMIFLCNKILSGEIWRCWQGCKTQYSSDHFRLPTSESFRFLNPSKYCRIQQYHNVHWNSSWQINLKLRNEQKKPRYFL